jgi:peptide/nickel transport system substrate-binding protein
MRKRFSMLRQFAIGLVSLAMTLVGVAAISAPTSGAAGATKTTVTDVGTAPGAAVNYIFPFMGLTKFSAQNVDWFQYYMYRPLYMFGNHDSITLNAKLSLASKPTFSNGDKTVKISLKTYKWSDTEKVDATGILFWLNMWHQKSTLYAEWFPGGYSFPTIISSVKATSPTTVTMTLKKAVNPTFFLDNDLSTISPLPLAWTVTSLTAAAGSGGCATAPFTTTGPNGANAAKCKAVYDFLSEQSGFNPTRPKTTVTAFGTYATSKIWSVVDGPWQLTSFTPTVAFTLKVNTKYSGPNKPRISKYIDKVYTSTSAEFDALATGALDVGQLPATEVTTPAKKRGTPGVPPVAGKNNVRLTSTYVLSTAANWAFTYFNYNMKSTGDGGNAGPIFSQLYFRQAMQHLMNQTLFIRSIDHTYGTPQYSPVPDVVKTPLLSAQAKKNPFPYSVSDAVKILKAHGWKVVVGGTDTCEKPGTGSSECGAGVKKGAKMSFTFSYSTTPSVLKEIMDASKSSWSSAGIHVNLLPGSFDTVYGSATPCPSGCKWEIADWGGWLYTHALPTGTELFAKGASSNSGSFSTPTSTKLITDVVTSKSKSAFIKYENWEETHIPVGYENTGVRLYEVKKGLEGVTPTDPMDTLTPATYHWT